MDAQTKLRREECALSMGQKLNTNDAILKDVKIKSSKEECALGMEQRQSANTRDAPIMLSREEFASGTGQKLNYAAIQDALIRLREEEYASSMGQHGQRHDEAEEIAQSAQREEV